MKNFENFLKKPAASLIPSNTPIVLRTAINKKTSINLGNVLTTVFPIDKFLPEPSTISEADCSFAFKIVNTITKRINNVVLASFIVTAKLESMLFNTLYVDSDLCLLWEALWDQLRLLLPACHKNILPFHLLLSLKPPPSFLQD